jgi:hypothetical protein
MATTAASDADTGRTGWLTFAAVVMLSIGTLRVISAIYYFADSSRVNSVSGGAFSHHLFVWGVWDLLIAALALIAGVSLLRGRELGFVLGYGFAGLVIVQSFLILAAEPWYGIAALLLAVLVIHALAINDVKGEGLPPRS